MVDMFTGSGGFTTLSNLWLQGDGAYTHVVNPAGASNHLSNIYVSSGGTTTLRVSGSSNHIIDVTLDISNGQGLLVTGSRNSFTHLRIADPDNEAVHIFSTAVENMFSGVQISGASNGVGSEAAILIDGDQNVFGDTIVFDNGAATYAVELSATADGNHIGFGRFETGATGIYNDLGTNNVIWMDHTHGAGGGGGGIAHADTTGQTTDDHHAEAHTIASHSDTTATGAELETLTDGSNADALHAHAGGGAHTVASHSDTTGTGAELETLTDGSNADALHAHVSPSHTVVSHSDTTATGLELDELTDGSTTTLHNHAGGGSSPLTTKGDLYGYDTADARLPVGTNDHVLTADSTAGLGVAWKASTTGGLDLTTKGQIHTHDTGDAALTVGANDEILVADSATATGLDWKTIAVALEALATTKGDVLVNNGTTVVRLPVGTNNHVLTADSAQAEGVKWAAGGGGSGGSATVLLRMGDIGADAVWLLNEGSGTNANDSRGNWDQTYSGTLAGMGSTALVDSVNSWDLNGTDDNITFPGAWEIPDIPSQSFTFYAVISPDSVTGKQVLFKHGGTSSGFVVYLDGTSLEVSAHQSNLSRCVAASTTTIATSTTYQICAVWFGARHVRLYVNGALEGIDDHSSWEYAMTGTADANLGASNAGGTRFGDDTTSTTGFYSGRLSHAAVWNRALADWEVGYVYDGSSPW